MIKLVFFLLIQAYLQKVKSITTCHDHQATTLQEAAKGGCRKENSIWPLSQHFLNYIHSDM